VCGLCLGLGLAPGVRDAGEDAPAVVVAHLATDVPVVLQALHEAGEGALGEVNFFGELLDAAVPLGRVVEPPQDLVLGEGEAVIALEGVLERLAHPSVLGLKLHPPIQKLVSVVGLRHLASLLSRAAGL
jgi:hypothetical protein